MIEGKQYKFINLGSTSIQIGRIKRYGIGYDMQFFIKVKELIGTDKDKFGIFPFRHNKYGYRNYRLPIYTGELFISDLEKYGRIHVYIYIDDKRQGFYIRENSEDGTFHAVLESGEPFELFKQKNGRIRIKKLAKKCINDIKNVFNKKNSYLYIITSGGVSSRFYEDQIDINQKKSELDEMFKLN